MINMSSVQWQIRTSKSLHLFRYWFVHLTWQNTSSRKWRLNKKWLPRTLRISTEYLVPEMTSTWRYLHILQSSEARPTSLFDEQTTSLLYGIFEKTIKKENGGRGLRMSRKVIFSIKRHGSNLKKPNYRNSAWRSRMYWSKI